REILSASSARVTGFKPDIYNHLFISYQKSSTRLLLHYSTHPYCT
ncbi:hypothetical protein, partial [Serratia bockelmannii]